VKSTRKVSAVVCTLESENTIVSCLESLRSGGVDEIILVDGGSKDATVAKSKGLYDILLRDPGLGLGLARNLGLRASTCDYVLNFGSDNVASQSMVKIMLSTLIDSNSAAVGAMTRVTAQNYWGRSINFWRIARFRVGYAPVVGTPSLFVASILSENLFNTKRTWSDDGELCDRLAELGHSFYNSEAIVYEIGRNSWRDVLTRWRMYGISDWETFSGLREEGASSRRLWKSITHPFVVELIRPLRTLNSLRNVQYIPFLIGITLVRYLSWINAARIKINLGAVNP